MRDPDAPDERIADLSMPDQRLDDPQGECAWFREELKSRGVTPTPGSHLARSLDWIDEMAIRVRANEPPPADEDQSEKLRSASSTLFMIRALRPALQKSPRTFESCWHLFRGADVSLIAYDTRTQQRDKIWEVLVSAICARAFDRVTIADHEVPDVRCFRRDEPWGIECKVLYSRNVSAQRDDLIAGAKQIEDSGLTNGVLAVNITALLDHRAFLDTFRFFPARAGFSDSGQVSAALREQAEPLIAAINTPAFRRRLFKNDRPSGPRISTRLILFWAQTLGFSRGNLVLGCHANWIAYEEAVVKDAAFINRFMGAIAL